MADWYVTLGRCSASFYKGNNFCGFLFAYLETKSQVYVGGGGGGGGGWR